jgi:hypothetical protein
VVDGTHGSSIQRNNCLSSEHCLSRNLSVEKLFVLVAIFLSFSPFFSPIPLHTDVQPAFLVPLLFLFFTKKMQAFNSYELTFALLALFSVFYVDVSDPYFSFRKSSGLLIAFLAYHFFRIYSYHLTSRILFIIVLFNFLAVLFHYLMPNLFAATLGQFVRTIKILSMDGARGASGFAAEPGFSGAMSVFYLAVAVFLKEFRSDSRYYKAIVVLCIIMLALSKSGTGGLLLILFVGVMYFRFHLRHIFGGVFLVAILYFLVANFDFGRAGFAIRMLFENPHYLFLVDASVGQRVINVLVGFISLYEFPFGAGAGSYERVASFIIEKYGLSHVVEGKSGNVSAFAKYSVELGIFFWTFMAMMVFKAVANSGSRALKYIFVALFYLSASFSIIFPPVWFLFAILNQRKRRVPLIR